MALNNRKVEFVDRFSSPVHLNPGEFLTDEANDTLYIGETPVTETGFLPEGTIEITENGDYDVSVYENAHVLVDTQAIGTLDITANGRYNVSGYLYAQVNVPLSDIHRPFWYDRVVEA